MVELDLLDPDGLAPLPLGQQHLRGAGLVDHVDRLVGELAVVDVFGRQLHCRFNRLARIAHAVEILEIGLETFEDLDRVGHRGLVHVDLLEAPDERPVLLEMLAVLLISGRADAAERTRLQRGLEQVGRVHGAARGGARADHRVDLVDEHDGAGIVLDLAHHRLEPLLEIAAVTGAGQERAHVELKDGGIGQYVGHIAHDDAAREPLGDGRLAHAGIAHEQRVVLLPPAQHLDGALDLRPPPDQGIDAAGARLLIEVDAIDLERVGTALLVLAALHRGRVVVDAAHRTRLGHAGPLGDTVADIVDRVEARHVLLLQEERGVALTLGEDGDEHVGAGDLLAARGLDMSHSAVDDALEPGRRLRVAMGIEHQPRQLAVDIAGELVAQQIEIDVASAHHRRGVTVVDQGEKQMLERGIFVAAFIGVLQRAPQSLLETGRERSHFGPTLSPSCTAADARAAEQSSSPVLP